MEVELREANYTIPEHARVQRKKVPVFSSHLNLMRGIAALTVMIGHLKFFLGDIGKVGVERPTGLVLPLQVTTNAMNPAHESVIVFFVLSGLLVGGSVLRDAAADKFSWGVYLLKRLSRLLTVLVPALAFGCLFDLTTQHLVRNHGAGVPSGLIHLLNLHLGWKVWVQNLLFLQTLDRTQIFAYGSNAALWSLAYEFWYYLLFPLVVMSIAGGPWLRRLVYGTLAALIGYLLWRDPLSRFIIWLMGAWLASIPMFVPSKWQRLGVGLMTLQFVVCACFFWRYPTKNLFIGDLLLALSFSALVVAVLHRQMEKQKGIYAMCAERLADCSYTLYLFHLPILTLLCTLTVLYTRSALSHRSLVIVVLSPIVFAICYVFHLAFEANTDKVRRWAGGLVASSTRSSVR